MVQADYDQELHNPCLKEHKISLKCLSDNDYDKEKCEMQFSNYRSCKEFWNSVRLSRKRNGIYPNIPPIEERNQIKNDYKLTGKLPDWSKK